MQGGGGWEGGGGGGHCTAREGGGAVIGGALRGGGGAVWGTWTIHYIFLEELLSKDICFYLVTWRGGGVGRGWCVGGGWRWWVAGGRDAELVGDD